MKLHRLFQPAQIGTMKLRNSIVMAPMATRFAAEEGYVSQRLSDYYAARAQGGVGLIIIEDTTVDTALGRDSVRRLAIDDERFLPGLAELARAIQQHGARAAVQLGHAGREARTAGAQPVAPSAVPAPWTQKPRELTLEEIKGLVERFAECALRAKRAGFDGVEIHGAHGYLVAEFLSPITNQRQDEYGGDAARRSRFLAEIVRACKEKAGADYPVWCRMNGREYGVEGGLTIEDAQVAARLAQAAGADAIHVSAFGYGAEAMVNMPGVEGSLLPLAEAIKKVVSVPVIAVGRLTPELGEEVLRQGRADLIAIARALLADPELPNKAAQGRFDDIAPCINCFKCVDSVVYQGRELVCTVNAALGREREYTLARAEKPRRVVVVGGGPAGMEVARVAALRGHQVTLYEKEGQLGGQLLQAAVPPTKSPIQALTRYLSHEVAKLGVVVELGKEATPEVLWEQKPDAVVLATGVRPTVPHIPGLDRANVVHAEDVLSAKASVGQRVVVIGGEMVGCETADFLAHQGKTVTVTRRGPRMAVKVMRGLRSALLERLRGKGVTLLTGVRYEEAPPAGLVITDKDGNRRTIQADTVVLAAGAEPRTELQEALRGRVPELHLVGDCVEPRGILEAIHEGSRVSRAL